MPEPAGRQRHGEVVEAPHRHLLQHHCSGANGQQGGQLRVGQASRDRQLANQQQHGQAASGHGAGANYGFALAPHQPARGAHQGTQQSGEAITHGHHQHASGYGSGLLWPKLQQQQGD